jgi:acyl-coenzyme A thioesterase PaaI-like protein
MSRTKPEPVQVVKQRRDALLKSLVDHIPYIQFMGISFERRGDELTALLPFREDLIGNPMLPALHGGVTAGLLEITAIVGLAWSNQWNDMESGDRSSDAPHGEAFPRMPKTIDFTVDYLRSGLPRDAYARALVTRSGRRYASVRAEAWQDNRARPFAQAHGHFLMPQSDD